ncbi:endo-1,4-beta-xylanase [Coleofasciculus sp. E2-BRE-01]|uniref:endo-1,4-beta-xylanase n=1 Tax=Coleofasciculus sp. E2-BRE-01 TaxID=3069524 RepID=UPI0032FA2450
MKIGTSVSARLLGNKKYTDLLIRHFDCLYSDSNFNSPDQIKRAKLISQFAADHDKSLRGNCLISHYQQPDKHLIKSKLLTFYEIKEWECVHEVIGYKNFRKGWNQEKLEACFLMAKEQRSDSLLFYADYFREESKWEKCYQILEVALAKEIPIDGLSVQLMANLRPSILNPGTLDLKMTQKWIKKIKADFNIKICAPETVVWQPINFNRSVDFIQECVNLKYACNYKKEVLRSFSNLLLTPFNIDFLQLKAYQQIISVCYDCVDLIGFWSAFDASPWNWYGNRCKAGLWDDDFQPKKAADVLLMFKG